MTLKGTKVYSILRNRCPHCHEGKFFTESNPYRLSACMKMDRQCSVCGGTYEPEAGFYYGAMYVSYAYNVAWFVSVWVATSVLLPADTNMWLIIGLMMGTGVVLAPVTLRLARLTWINIFVSYDKDAIRNKNQISHPHLKTYQS